MRIEIGEKYISRKKQRFQVETGCELAIVEHDLNANKMRYAGVLSHKDAKDCLNLQTDGFIRC